MLERISLKKHARDINVDDGSWQSAGSLQCGNYLLSR